jgi:ketosteroid isomerase-like protein
MKKSNNTLAAELLGLERQYWQAMKDKDVDAAMRLTDEECVVTGAQGVASVTREALAEMLTKAPYVLHDFELKDPKVRELQDDVAILAYTIREELTVDGKDVQLDAADASTWIRRSDGWRCALHTEAILGDPFGRDRRA